jgi:NAD(P)H-hydrate epimerase
MKKVLSAAQWKEADGLYIQAAGITSLELMERAAVGCADWLDAHWQGSKKVVVLAGHGHNGGDGLAIARLLAQKGHLVKVYRIEDFTYAADNQANAAHLANELWLKQDELKEALSACDVIVDSLLGFGTSRKAVGAYADCIALVNSLPQKTTYSVDLPSGMPAELPFDKSWPIVVANHTLCLESWKLNLLIPPGGSLAGEVHFIPLGLSAVYQQPLPLASAYDAFELAEMLPKRPRFAHKGDFGHALLIAGSTGMWGAGLLAAEACMRTGAGKTTLAGPDGMRTPLAIRLPEAMYLQSGIHCWDSPLATAGFTSLGIGPGLGKAAVSSDAFRKLLVNYSGPLVLDADALNLLAESPELFDLLPTNTILTPHMGEFDRLFGLHTHWWTRLETAQKLSRQKGWVIVLKNAYTFIFSAEWPYPIVNSTGSTGLAKAGSGDVLTGIITGLLAQGLESRNAAILGVHLHGLAADLARTDQPEASILPSDVIGKLGHAISILSKTSISY